MRAWRAIALLLLSASAAAENHLLTSPNGRAAAECARVFFDDGNLPDAKFFANLAKEEGDGLTQPLISARIEAREGRRFDELIQRWLQKNPGKAKTAADALLRGAHDLARRGRSFDVHMAVMTAVQDDPSLRPVARSWVLSYVRAVLTAHNAFELRPLLIAATPKAAVSRDRKHVDLPDDPEVLAFALDVARRALAMHQPKVAALYADLALELREGRSPAVARIYIDVARALTPKEPALVQEAARMAIGVDPLLENDEELLWLRQMTASCGRGELLREYVRRFPSGSHVRQAREALKRAYAGCGPIRFAGATCGNTTSPFAEGLASDERFYPDAIYTAPLPPEWVNPNAAGIEARCRTLAPPMFPDPFDVNQFGRDAAERIYEPDESSINEMPPPCVEQSSWEIVIGADGRMEKVHVIDAMFPGEDRASPSAMAAEQAFMIPILSKQKYRPGRIRGVPVRSSTWLGVVRICERRGR